VSQGVVLVDVDDIGYGDMDFFSLKPSVIMTRQELPTMEEKRNYPGRR